MPSIPRLVDWAVDAAAPPEVKENGSSREEGVEDMGEVMEKKRKKKKVGFHDRKVYITSGAGFIEWCNFTRSYAVYWSQLTATNQCSLQPVS